MTDEHEADTIVVDETVHTADSRPVGPAGKCTYCLQAIGEAHRPDCVIMNGRRFRALPAFVWLPIKRYISGYHVVFWFPKGERGNGGFESANAWPDEDGVLRAGWTHGGPNAGLDFRFPEPPTLFMRLADPA